MSYRTQRGGRAAKRRQHKESVQSLRTRMEVRQWLERHPPRVDLPTSLGSWRDGAVDPSYEVAFEPTPRPKAPFYEVPIMDRFASLSGLNPSLSQARGPAMQFLRMRPVQMGLRYGATRLCWWNWEPMCGVWDAEADIYRAVSKALAFMERVTSIVKEVAQYDRNMLTGVPNEYVVSWWKETMEALGAWAGYVKTRYVIPARDPQAPPEPRERVSR